VSIYTACAPTRSLFLLRLVHLQLSCIAIYAELSTTIALVQSLLNSSIICPALVDITAFVDITFFALLANMRRRQSRRQSHRQSVDSSSDEYELTDSETEYHSGSETEPTDVDNDIDEVIEDVEDAEGLIDCAYLLADEVHPPEYYLKQMEEFDESEFTTEDYSDGTTRLLDRIEEQWCQ
jgi:hypothetical protein